MAKKRQPTAIVKLHIAAGQATPAPPVGPALAQHGVNIGEFTKQFNDATKENQGFKIPVEVNVYNDKSFDFVLHEPPAAELLKKAAGIEKGSGTPNRKKSAKITEDQLRQVAEAKMSDLNTDSIEEAMSIIEGTAKSLGMEVTR